MPTGYIRHFHACNRHDLGNFVRFFIGNRHYGWIARELAASLQREFDFLVAHEDGLALAGHLHSFETRSAAFAEAMAWISKQTGKKLRQEIYPVIRKWGDVPLAQIDRSGIPWFGLPGFGVHANGFVRRPEGIYLWIGERALDRPADPGLLDNMIAGGQPIGLSLTENLAKEAREEAGVEPTLAARAVQVTTLRYLYQRPDGLRNDTLFVYDLEVPENFTPRNTDGEVQAFHRMDLAKVAGLIHGTDRFKFNCNLVIIDFLIRHGHLKATDPEVAEITGILDHMALPN